MNLDIAALPLPVLAETATSQHRRRRIGNLQPDPRALRSFHEAAGSLGTDQSIPDVDAIASVARRLTRQFAGSRRAPCIRLRLRCLAALRAMATEPAWALDPAKQQRISLITRYAANQDRLVPDAVPVIGGLDEALLVELAWPQVQFDLDDYLDFRRLRAEEAALRGVHPHTLGYDREQWLQSRFAELTWLAHTRRRGCESYLQAAAPAIFRVN
jgi:hypothetical protein